MRKHISSILTIVTVVVVIALALYSMGVFDSGKLLMVSGKEFDAGGFLYSGGLEDGSFSGNGIIEYGDGDSYSGGFVDGRFHGRAVFASSGADNGTGWRFVGEFRDGLPSNGSFFFSDGTQVSFDNASNTNTFIGQSWQYAGRFNENGQNGPGVFVFEDGFVYDGDFTDGLANWEGTLTDAEGNVIYSGEIRNGYFDGIGVYFSPDGWSYEGSFKNGLFDGEGVITDGSTVIYGVWERGVQITRYG